MSQKSELDQILNCSHINRTKTMTNSSIRNKTDQATLSPSAGWPTNLIRWAYKIRHHTQLHKAGVNLEAEFQKKILKIENFVQSWWKIVQDFINWKIEWNGQPLAGKKITKNLQISSYRYKPCTFIFVKKENLEVTSCSSDSKISTKRFDIALVPYQIIKPQKRWKFRCKEGVSEWERASLYILIEYEIFTVTMYQIQPWLFPKFEQSNYVSDKAMIIP